MNAELLKQRAEFQKHAARNVSVQQRPTAESSYTTYKSEDNKKKKKKKPVSSDPQLNAKSLSEYNKGQGLPSGPAGITPGGGEANAMHFSLLAKIVDYMKRRHLEAKQWGLTLKEILDELQLHDVSKKAEMWLIENLPNNRRLNVDEDGRFTFRPPYKVKNRATLLQLLQKFERDGKGGVLLSELNECMPNIEKHVQSLGNQVITMTTQHNKRKDQVYFYNNSDTDYTLDDDFKQLWRSVSVDHLDEKKIEEYLQKHGIRTMKDLQPKKIQGGAPKRKAVKRKINQKVHNEHLSDVLQDYEQP
uniref:Transcription initiation factor IIE subunit beta n=1 Tax=Steinernema glaseri TaxID=37863 RepID=A0A1I7XX74_9BILA